MVQKSRQYKYVYTEASPSPLSLLPFPPIIIFYFLVIFPVFLCQIQANMNIYSYFPFYYTKYHPIYTIVHLAFFTVG